MRKRILIIRKYKKNESLKVLKFENKDLSRDSSGIQVLSTKQFIPEKSIQTTIRTILNNKEYIVLHVKK